ncbi:MAG: hypothetical protein AB7P03_05790 [Kofleriaceae bacterium]
MKTILNTFVVAMIVSVSACGGSDETDNVAACEAFVEQVKCGSIDISNQANCSAYAQTTCDISDYFDCLADKYVCVNGMYDEAKLATLDECIPKSSCN